MLNIINLTSGNIIKINRIIFYSHLTIVYNQYLLVITYYALMYILLYVYNLYNINNHYDTIIYMYHYGNIIP